MAGSSRWVGFLNLSDSGPHSQPVAIDEKALAGMPLTSRLPLGTITVDCFTFLDAEFLFQDVANVAGSMQHSDDFAPLGNRSEEDPLNLEERGETRSLVRSR